MTIPQVSPASRVVLTTVLKVLGLVLIYVLLPIDRGNRLGVVLGVGVVLAMLPLLGLQVRRILASRQPMQDAIAALVVGLALLVLGPAAVYYAVATADPAAFRGLSTKIDAVYFTVVVTSTVGFGDITPAGQLARLLTTAHILMTLVFVGSSVRVLTRAAQHRIGQVGG